MWSLGAMTLDDELEPACVALEHFALGDLEGIAPANDEPDEASAAHDEEEDEAGGGGAVRVWSERVHQGAINCVASHGRWLATASSDGWVRVFEWCAQTEGEGEGGGGALLERHALAAHEYPATAVDFGAGGTVLLSAGYDGRACLWDVQTGVQLRVLSAPEGEAAGGGGVRDARLAPGRPARALLATDDGVAALWDLAGDDPRPELVAARAPDALTCCAWAPDAHLAAAGAASGDLRVLAPHAGTLHLEARAHDLGVQSCDFAPSCSELALPECTYLLATAGCDSLIKLWMIDTQQAERASGARVQLARQLEAHGGGAACVRWASALLASAGGDRWARVWRAGAAGTEMRAVGAAPAAGAGGATAVALLLAAPAPALPLLACGTLAGELALWRLPAEAPSDRDEDEDEGAPATLWGPAGVARWLRESVTRAPGALAGPAEEAALLRRARSLGLTGAALLAGALDDVLDELGYGVLCEEGAARAARCDTRARLRDELAWLRCAPPPPALEAHAPHALLCPLAHSLLREPARAADGYSYERAHLLDWFIAAEGAVSPVTSRRLRNAHVALNYALRDTLRQFLRDSGHAPSPSPR